MSGWDFVEGQWPTRRDVFSHSFERSKSSPWAHPNHSIATRSATSFQKYDNIWHKISFIFNIYQRSFKYHSITSCKVGFCMFLPSCKKASHRSCRTLGSAATFTVSGQVSQWFCANSTTSNPTSQVWLSSLLSLSWSSFNQALNNQSQNIVQVWLVFAWKSSLHRAFTFLQAPWI